VVPVSGPRILATDGSKFRIVRIEDGDRVTNVLEKADGFDALGCERWRTVNVGEADNLTRWMRDFIIGHAIQCPQLQEK
jgi:hypothetical protein